MIPGLSTAKLIGLGLVALVIVSLAVALKISHSDYLAAKAEKQLAQGQRDQAVGVANKNAQTIREVTAEREQFRAQAGAAADAFSKHKAAAYTQIAKLKKEVADATAQNECPVAPSVLAALRGLSGDGPPADGDRGAGNAPADPGRSH